MIRKMFAVLAVLAVLFGSADAAPKTCAIVAITWDPSRPADVTTWDMARFSNGTHVRGAAIAPFLQQFDTVILPHWPPLPMMQVLRASCPNVRFVLYVSIDAVPEQPAWAGGEQERFNQLLRQYRIAGTDGRPVNVYEGHATRTPVHSVNVTRFVAESTFAIELLRIRTVLGVHGFFNDSMASLAYYGTARNAPARENRHIAWLDCVRRIHTADPGSIVWGNTMQMLSVGTWDLDVVYSETSFVGKSRFDTYTCTAWTGSRLVLP